jgi:hypothetical protein
VREALVKLRRDGDERLGQRGVLERERSLVEARTRHILNAVKDGYATTTLLQELEREEARKGALVTELAQLADLERVASLDAAQVSRTLTTLAGDVRDVLAGGPGPARQMLRKLFAGIRSRARPSWRRTGRAATTSGPRGRMPPCWPGSERPSMGVAPTGSARETVSPLETAFEVVALAP